MYLNFLYFTDSKKNSFRGHYSRKYNKLQDEFFNDSEKYQIVRNKKPMKNLLWLIFF